jgi:hypothetical protein
MGHRVAGEHPVQHRVDGGGETGEQEGVIVPPRQPPRGAELQGQECPGSQQAGHHQRQLHRVQSQPPALPVHRADGDQGEDGDEHHCRAEVRLAG